MKIKCKICKNEYKNSVYNKSHLNAKNIFGDRELNRLGLCGKKNGLQIDHLFTVNDCYINNVPIEIAAHPSNLRLVPWQENRKMA